MLRYITSFFWKTENTSKTQLSLDEAYDVLQNEEKSAEADQRNEQTEEEEEEISNFETCLKIGKITQIINGIYTIDNVYTAKFNLPEGTSVGSTVSYQLLKSAGIIEIVDIQIVENDWNVLETHGKGKWCNRTVVGKVEKRIERHLVLSPDDLTIDLDKISTDFIPIVGDWIQLDAKCAVDESISDLSGKILEIKKISPLRPQIKSGIISSYDQIEKWGIIDKNIFFNLNSLCSGYLPCQGDKVVVEVIESDQGSCSWRALNIIPEYLKSTKKKSKNHRIIDNFDTQNQKDIQISHNLTTFDKLGNKKLFQVKIVNQSEIGINLKNVEYPKINGQCVVLNEIIDAEIPPNGQYKIDCECTARNMGLSREVLSLNFDTLKMQYWIDIHVLSPSNHSSNKFSHKQHSEVFNQKRNVIKGRNFGAARFIPIRLSDHPIPQKMLTIVTNCEKDESAMREQLELYRKSFVSNLSYMIYEDKLHNLVYLDEISSVLAMRRYTQDLACFIKNGEYLMLEIDNLAERRPSIIIGDKVIARNLIDDKNPDFEGVVHKVGLKHVYLKFSHLFHEKYNGEDYAVRVVSSRTTYKRKHNAISLAIRNLGREFLFPSKIVEKQPQTDLEIEIEWHNNNLNHYQKEAVKNILFGICRPMPYIIFGPPGTGKTITLVEVILQLIRVVPHSRILVAAPSNSAADLITTRLIDSGVLKPGDLVRLVSLNASVNISAKLAPYSVTANLETDGTQTNKPVVTESGLTLGCGSKFLGRHRITVSTCSSAGVMYQMGFPKGHFSHIIVDEAGQTCEPSVMIPLVFLDVTSGQTVLAGDPMQLGPVILSSLAAEYGLEESYLERLTNRFPYIRDPEGFPKNNGYDPRFITKLLYNYRSLPALLKLPSTLFYHNDLIPTLCDKTSDEAILVKRVKEMLPLKSNGVIPRIVFQGVIGENYQTEDSPSWFNPQEAAQVFYYINEFYRLGLSVRDIGIITPYKAQTKELCQLFQEAEFDIPKIGTVEDFQGQEFNVVVISTVRSNSEYVSSDIRHSLGFVANSRRLNVAITRAKSLLVIVGNPRLLSQDKCWKAVIQYCVSHGSYVGCEF